MLIQDLTYLETATDNSIQGEGTGTTAVVTVVGIGPSAAAFGALGGGLSFDAFGPLVSFDVAAAGAGAVGLGALGFGGNAGITTVTI